MTLIGYVIQDVESGVVHKPAGIFVNPAAAEAAAKRLTNRWRTYRAVPAYINPPA